MTRLKVGALIFITAIVQLTVFVDVRVFDVAPELLALVAVLSGFVAGPERGATIAFGAGLLWDVWLPTPLGVAAMSYALVAFGVGSVGSGLFRESRGQAALVVGAASAMCVVGYALLGEVVGQQGLVDVELLRVAILVGVMNAVVTPLVVRPLRWALRETGRAAAGAAVRA